MASFLFDVYNVYTTAVLLVSMFVGFMTFAAFGYGLPIFAVLYTVHRILKAFKSEKKDV